WPSRIASCRAMKAKMLWTSLRKSRSVPSLSSSGRLTVNGNAGFGLAASRRGAELRSVLVAFWRDKTLLRDGFSCIPWSTDHGQDVNGVGVPQGAPEHRIFQLHLEPARRPDAADRAKRAAKHHRAWRERRSIARQQVVGPAHAGECAVLVGHACSVDDGEGAQPELVPVTGDVLERPEMVADRLGAELLRQCDALGLGLAIGVVGADGEAKLVAERDDHRLHLARGIRPQHLEHWRLGQIQDAVAVEYRNRGRTRHPNGR